MSYQRGIRPDYTVGTITLVSNSKNFTTVGASLKTATIGSGDTIMTADGRVLIISEITGQNAGVLAYPCPASAAGANFPLRIRFQPSSSGVQGAVRDLLQRWGETGNIDALAGLATAKDMLAYFTGAGTVEVTALTEWARSFISAADGAKGYGKLGVVPDGSLRDGLKSYVPTITNLNTLTEGGSYWSDQNAIGVPRNGVNWYVEHYSHSSGQFAYQKAYLVSTASVEEYSRKKRSGVWEAWTDNSPIVSGDNANGYFVRFSDGTQLVRRSFATQTLEPTGPTLITAPFPASFLNSDIVVVAIPSSPTPSSFYPITLSSITANELTLAVDRPNVRSAVFRYIAMGRWR